MSMDDDAEFQVIFDAVWKYYKDKDGELEYPSEFAYQIYLKTRSLLLLKQFACVSYNIDYSDSDKGN